MTKIVKIVFIIYGICYNYVGGNKMKKNNLWKAIGICFVAFIVLSWIIPIGGFTGGIFSKGTVSPLGFMDIFRYPIITASTNVFLLTAFVILLMGGFYGILNQTGVYGKVVDKVTSGFKNNGLVFLAISILVFSILSSLTGLTLPLFVMVPFFVAVILNLGYKKVIAMLSTVGAILVGNMASTYGFNVNGYIAFFFEIGMNDTIVTRLLFYLVTIALFIGFVLFLSSKNKSDVKAGKKESKNEASELEIPLYKNYVDYKKSAVPVVVVSIFMMVLVLVGMYNWETGFNVDFFNNIYNSIMEFEISGYPIFKNLIGSIDPIGYWSNYELAIILFLATLLIAWIYNVKGKEKWNAFMDGVKEMVPIAVYTVAASILFLLMNATSSTGATFFNTIANFFITMTKGFNAFTFGLASMIGGVFYNDFPYLLNSLYGPITSLYTNFGFIGILMQMLHGFVMLIAPTSIILVAGLRFLNISYTEWFKNVWKYLLLALLSIVTFSIVLLLIG